MVVFECYRVDFCVMLHQLGAPFVPGPAPTHLAVQSTCLWAVGASHAPAPGARAVLLAEASVPSCTACCTGLHTNLWVWLILGKVLGGSLRGVSLKSRAFP